MLLLMGACVYGVYSLTQIIYIGQNDHTFVRYCFYFILFHSILRKISFFLLILIFESQVEGGNGNVLGQRIVGLVLSGFSFLLIYPITISLLMSQFGSKNTSILDVSMRHFTLLFMIILVVIIYAFNFDTWRWEAFSSYASLGWPALDLSRFFKGNFFTHTILWFKL